MVLTHDDDDFLVELDKTEYRAVLWVNDATIPSGMIADAIHRMSKQYPQAEIDGVIYVDS